MITAGCGCRTACDARDVLQALERALAAAGKTRAELAALCVPEFKADERGLVQVAAQLSVPLWLVSSAALQAHAGAAVTRSERALARAGVPSVAETAALAGALRLAGLASDESAHVTLLGARQIAGGATCALASFARTRAVGETAGKESRR
jgi:cobalt-precorrin 5A hydrolase